MLPYTLFEVQDTSYNYTGPFCITAGSKFYYVDYYAQICAFYQRRLVPYHWPVFIYNILSRTAFWCASDRTVASFSLYLIYKQSAQLN